MRSVAGRRGLAKSAQTSFDLWRRARGTKADMARVICPRCAVQLAVDTPAPVVTCPRCLAAIAVKGYSATPPPLPRPVIPLENEVRRDLGVSRAALIFVGLALAIGLVSLWQWVSNTSPYDQPQDFFFKHPAAVLGTLAALIACFIGAAISFSRHAPPHTRASGSNDPELARHQRAAAVSLAGGIVAGTLATLLSIFGAILLVILGIYLLITSVCGH